MNSLVILLFGSVANLSLGLVVLYKSKKRSIKWPFFLLTIALTLWAVANYFSVTVTESVPVLFWMRVVMGFAVIQAASFAIFAIAFPRGANLLKKTYLNYYFLVLLTIIVTQSPLLFSGVNINQETGARSPVIDKGMVLFLIIAVGSVVFGLFVLIRKYLHAKGNDRKLLAYLLVGIFTMFFLIIFYNLVFVAIFHVNSYVNLGPLFTLPFVALTTYAILVHQLFDIRVIIRKVFLYTSLLSIVFGTYTLFAFLLTSFLPLNQTISSFLAAAVIAFGFEPLRNKLQTITEKYLFVADYNADQELKHLTETLSSVVDLDEALRQVIKHLTRAMKLSRAAALVLVRDSKDVVTVRRIQEIAFPGSQRLMTEEYLPIVNLFLHEPRIRLVDLIQQEVDDKAIDDKTIKHQVTRGTHENLLEQVSDRALKKQALTLLKKVKVAVVVPIMVKQQLIGLLYLGEKLSNANFFEDDLNFITIVGSQTGSAIEKARFYEEDQLKSEFVSIASHELLTPTTAIEGYLSMILDENMAKVDPKAREYLQKVYDSSKRLSALVKDLLSVSRIEAGRMKIEPKVFDLGEVVQQQVDQLIFKAKDAGLTLTYIKPKKELAVFADPDRTAQAVVNLVGNSIKYTKQGSVTIELFDRPRHIEVAVTDTGIGIKPEDREHLFEKFQRINSADTTGIIGSGLGLYITKSIIELMNGVVTVKSTYGKGSTFAFTLPKKPTKS